MSPLRLIATLALLLPGPLLAATVQSFTPQGTVKDLRQVWARFSEAMVTFGDPRLADPFDIDCAAKGKGRWADERSWVYDFETDLPAGLSCRFRLKSGLSTLKGGGLTGKREFVFDTGGPAVRASLPRAGSESVDEQQLFLLALDAPATKASIEAKAWCAVSNLAERLPLQVLEGKAREDLLAQRRLLGYSYYRLLTKDGDEGLAQIQHDQLRAAEAKLVVARCARPLPAKTNFDLVWGKGVATASGAATQQDQVLRFRTRPAFTARFECERVKASAPCVPVLPMRLSFSAPVARQAAMQIRLKGSQRTRAPQEPEDESPFVSEVQWKPPFPEAASFEITLPDGFADDAGRALENATSFPLAVTTDEAPPLAKFSGEFGIIERAESVLPVTLRGLEDSVPAMRIGGASKRIVEEAEVLRWMQRTRAFMRSDWSGGEPIPPGRRSVFEDEAGAQSFSIDKPAGGKAFEVVGIPLEEPGFHVVELASPRLGAALLDAPQPRYVATTALVTNLAVHFKWGRQGSLVFVTTLDSGKPVDGAQLRIVDGCDGRPLWNGATDTQGMARIEAGLPKPESWSSCSDSDSHPLMVSARKEGDFSFVLSSWNEGIAPSDFKLNVGWWDGSEIAHTVLDRSLLRAGETVSMKHYWREHTASGIGVPRAKPDKLVITHSGSGQSVELPLSFDEQGIAETQWPIPKQARLGEYHLRFEGQALSRGSGSFRVEQYRIPLMRAQITPPAEPAVAVNELPLNLMVSYFSGGGAGGLPVKLRTQLRPRPVSFREYQGFRFGGEPVKEGLVENEGGGYFADEDQDDAIGAPKPARTLPLRLDVNGAAHTTITELPPAVTAQTLTAELEYPDANGELASVRAQIPLWPASVIVGLATDGWAGSRDKLRFQALALDLGGKPLKGQAIEVQAYLRKTHSYRKRLVGGFYAYSHSSEIRRIDARCGGRSDAQGLLHCQIEPEVSGEVILEAIARDRQGRVSRAVTSAWIAGADDWWFAQGDSDRMDVIPERREVEPGETLKLQVRSPFRKSTALVTVEREGVIDAFVTQLSGREPVVKLPIADGYAPNVYVSVLALRPRVSDFRSRLYDFLRKLHLDRWIQQWFGLDGGMPTATTDLSKPAYRLGIAPVDVGWTPHRLKVTVRPKQPTYATRSTAQVEVQVAPESGGKLPAAAEIAFSAVDEALLDLLPNPSVDLLDAMMRRRGIEVTTATAQMQVVGKRHYGRKAMAPGGGGGRGGAREILNSLLLWQGRVPLDQQGRALVEVPLNDALSAFRLTAVASAGADRFGTGAASIRTTQDLQLLSGLPPLVRENDRFDAVFTLRNTTNKAQELSVQAQIDAAGGQPARTQQAQIVSVPANGAAPVRFDVSVPYGAAKLAWTVTAKTADGKLADALKLSQEVTSAFPVRVYQATLLRLDAPGERQIGQPADALPGRGGIRVGLQSSLAGSLDTVREYMGRYPYSCYEQLASKAIATGDEAAWQSLMASTSNYIDGDGLLRYFPSNWLAGSDTLTAYVLALAHEAGREIPESEREQMLNGLEGFARGRIRRGSALNLSDQTQRKLATIEALSRYGRADAQWLSSITVEPNLWHTSALIDWIGILQRVENVPQRAARLEQALSILRSRLNFQGTTMGFSTERDDALWWLMTSADVNANRTILALLGEDAWREDLPRLVRGAVGRQLRGRWNLTTANAWGVLALEKFAAKFEREPVSGTTVVRLGDAELRHQWSADPAATLDLPWPAAAARLALAHQGDGAPWALVQSRAAIPLREPFSSGYRISRSVEPVEQKVSGRWTRGDVARVSLSIDAQSDMTWVVVEDPIPGGATILGGGLGRTSGLLAQGERRQGDAWPAFEERRFDFYRAYYEFLPKGRFTVEYTVRYNNAGRFEMPATRVEAMYSPEMLGESPNAAVEVLANPG